MNSMKEQQDTNPLFDLNFFSLNYSQGTSLIYLNLYGVNFTFLLNVMPEAKTNIQK